MFPITPTNSFNDVLLLNRLSAYEIAVLEFTSPQQISDSDLQEEITVITSKEAYLWAGTAAYILSVNSELSEDDFKSYLYRAAEKYQHKISAYYNTFDEQTSLGHNLGAALVATFLEEAGFSAENLSQIRELTKQAVNNLESYGLIEDPPKKWIRGALISLIFLLPINFTNKTENGQTVSRRIETIAVEYERLEVPNQKDKVEHKVKLKTQKIAKFLKDEIPKAIDLFLEEEKSKQP